MRIATVQMHDGPKLVVDVDGDYRRLDFDFDLLSLVQAGVDPRNIAVEPLAFCSRNFTLEPGDLMLTGTPWGCGYFMDPPRTLQIGDVVECEVERIGVLRNTVAAA